VVEKYNETSSQGKKRRMSVRRERVSVCFAFIGDSF